MAASKLSLFLGFVNVKVVAVTTAIVAVAVSGVIIIQVNQNRIPTSGTGLSGVILGEGQDPTLTQQQLQDALDKQANENKLTFSIASETVFEDNKGKLTFGNPPHSAHDLDLEVIIAGNVVVKTSKIKPNQYIEQVELIGKKLKSGKHEAEAYIRAYHRETGQYINQAIAVIDIIIP